MGVPQKTDFVVALSALNVPEPVVQPPPADDAAAADDLWVKLCVPCAAAGGRPLTSSDVTLQSLSTRSHRSGATSCGA